MGSNNFRDLIWKTRSNSNRPKRGKSFEKQLPVTLLLGGLIVHVDREFNLVDVAQRLNVFMNIHGVEAAGQQVTLKVDKCYGNRHS